MPATLASTASLWREDPGVSRDELQNGQVSAWVEGVVHAVAHLGGTIAVEHEKDWVRLRRFHKMQDRSPPWRPFTYVFHVSILKRVRVPFRHPRGALSIVAYRP